MTNPILDYNAALNQALVISNTFLEISNEFPDFKTRKEVAIKALELAIVKCRLVPNYEKEREQLEQKLIEVTAHDGDPE